MRRRLRPSSFLTVAVLGGAVCSAADARAAGVPVRIDVAAGNSCGDAATIEATMIARGVVVSRRRDEPTVASVRVASKGPGMEGTLVLSRPSGRTTRVVVAASCAEVLDAMAFTLALALEDGAPAPAPSSAPPSSALPSAAPSNTAPPSAAPSNTAPPPNTAPPSAAPPSAAPPNTATPSTATPNTAPPNTAPPSTAPPNTATPSTDAPAGNRPPGARAPATTPPSSDRVTTPPRDPRGLEIAAGAGAGLLAGVSPTVGASLGAWAMIGSSRTTSWFAPALFGGVVIGLPVDAQAGTLRATSALQAVTFDLCPARLGSASLALRPCARAVAGRSQVRSEGFVGARLDDRFFATLGLAARAEGRVAGPVFVHLELALGVPVERATYFIGTSRLFETPALSLGGAAGAGVHF